MSKIIGKTKTVKEPIVLWVVGNTGNGKRTMFKLLKTVISEQQPIMKIGFNDIDSQNLDMVIFTNEKGDLIDLVERSLSISKNKLTLALIDKIEYFAQESKIKARNERVLSLVSYTTRQIIEILQKRIDYALTNKENDYANFMREIIVPKIAKQSKGNLAIAFDMMKKAFLNYSISGELDFENITIDSIKLTNLEKKIVSLIVKEDDKSITTTILTKKYGYERTVAWKYLEALLKKEILSKIYGNPSVYTINLKKIPYLERALN